MNNSTLTSEQLNAAISQAEKDIALYARLKAASKVLSELQNERQARCDAFANETALRQERQIAAWEVRRIDFTHVGIGTSITDSRTVTAYHRIDKREVTTPLEQIDSFLRDAILRVPEKLPADILALADSPENALDRWCKARRRGFLANEKAYVAKFL